MRGVHHVLAALMVVVGCCAAAVGADGRVISVVKDFEDGKVGDKRPAVLLWNWTPEQKEKAIEFSSIEIVGDAPIGDKCLKLTVTEAMPPGPSFRVVPLSIDYLPPEADTLRMRVKVLSGKLKLAAGGPTVYFGHSDVLSSPIELSADTHADWTTVEFDLADNLTRNFRRSEWATKSPVIYYTRWIQEPMAINMLPGTAGEALIDQVELVDKGRGRPYPTFTPDDLKPIGPVHAASALHEASFTIMTSVAQATKLDGPPTLVRPVWAPPRVSKVTEDDRECLEVVMTGVEEACFAGVKVKGVAGANAIALKMKVQNAMPRRPGVVIDFAAYAAPADQRDAFPWETLRPPVSWRDQRDIAFTYYLSPRYEWVQPITFGLYHVRRLLPNDQWTTVVLPLPDFACYYGQQAMERAFQEQLPLESEQIFALSLLSYYAQRGAPTRILIEELSFVNVPGSAEELRSFPQAKP